MTPEGQIIEAMIKIANKQGEVVPFKLNSAQRWVDENLTGRDLVPKARQEGISSYVLARWMVKCMTQENVRAVVISHDTESTQRMLAKVRFYIEHLPAAPVLRDDSKNHISFPKTGSHFFIGTAGSRQFGRGDTITHLHCSEVAFWSDPKSLTAGLFQAVPGTGEIILESTGNGVGNYYHQMCMNAYAGTGKYNCIFLPWHDFDEYQVRLSDRECWKKLGKLQEDLEEDILKDKLTPQQLLWRRDKLEELVYDVKLFKQEYPMTLDECFQGTGSSCFYRLNYKESSDWKKESKELYRLQTHPRKGHHYILGADPAGGTGRDDSVVEVFCLETGEQVAEYVNNRISPDFFASKIDELGRLFNEGFVVVEANNHGIVTLNELRKIYPDAKIYKKNDQLMDDSEDTLLLNYGYRTTASNKPLIVGTLAKALASDLTIYSPLLKNQCNTFIEHENGKLEAEIGCKDDAVMAAGMMYRGWDRSYRFVKEKEKEAHDPYEEFKLDNLLKELHKQKDGNLPIRVQV